MDWKQELVDKFIPELESKVWAVFDPDAIVRNEQILGPLQAKGFDVVFFDDPLAFRYEYESRIRREWERGEKTPLVLIFDDRAGGFNGLPSDVLASAHLLEFGLEDLFSNLDPDVLRELGPDTWTTLSHQAAKHPGKKFRASETEELSMKVGYRLVPELIDSPVELIRRLIDLHRGGLELPERLCLRLERELCGQAPFAHWPVRDLAGNPGLFWQFLQERWTRFIRSKVDDGDPAEVKEMSIQSVPDLPFDDPALKIYIDTLFTDGLLDRVDVGGIQPGSGQWWMVGVSVPDTPPAPDPERVTKLLDEIPSEDGNHRDWIRFGINYSRLAGEVFRSGETELIDAFWSNLWPEVDRRFSRWLETGYTSLHSLPASPPAMVRHVPKQMGRWLKDGGKVALIVLDGLSLAGWFTVRQHLLAELSEKVRVEDSAAFAWLPTLTPVCRQALYSGLRPGCSRNPLSGPISTLRDGRNFGYRRLLSCLDGFTTSS